MFELHESHPGALWFVQHYGFFVYDSALQPTAPRPGTVMRLIPAASYWQNAFTSRPVTIFWVLHGSTVPAFIPEGNQRLLYEDEWEQSMIVMSEIPAGYGFKIDSDIVEPSLPD
jgi:hypothetical protein